MTKDSKFVKYFSQFFTKIKQFVFLSVKSCGYNNLWESAASCSYSFIFSVVPVVLIILTVLISILKVEPELLKILLDFCERFSSFYDFNSLINNLINKKSFSFIDIFVGIWVIWMARKMFMSIIQAMYRIFRSKTKRLSIFNQALTFISEFVLVVLFIIVMIFVFLFNKFLKSSIFNPIKESFPLIFNTNSNRIVSSVLYLMLFLITLYFYKFMSGTKPDWSLCLFYAGISTGVTFVISFFINKFMHFTNYNIIYGTISTLFIFLFKVYMFFAVFLVCAQMVFVSQFFEELLIAQLYTMQRQTGNSFANWWTQKFFGKPYIHKLKVQAKKINAGEKIYSEGEKSDFVYFIQSGKVEEINDGVENFYGKGEFFGEISGILNTRRITSAVAVENCNLMIFETDVFLDLIQKNKAASSKALKRLNRFTSE